MENYPKKTKKLSNYRRIKKCPLLKFYFRTKTLSIYFKKCELLKNFLMPKKRGYLRDYLKNKKCGF